MSFLGFDPLGHFSLGQIGDPKPSTLVGSGAWQTPAKKLGLSAAILATVGSGFVPQPPQVIATQPTPVFTKFSQPAPVVGTKAYLQPQSVMGVGLVSLAVTPGPLVFPLFSQPSFYPVKQAVHAAQPYYQIRFVVATTPTSLVFSTYSQPRFEPVRQTVYTSPKFEVFLAGAAITPISLVYSAFSQPPPIRNFPAHLQPQPATRGYFYTFYDDAEVIQVLQELRVSYSDSRDFFSAVEIATVPEETRIASLFQEDRVLVAEPKKLVEADAEFRSDALPNRLRIK